MDELSIEFAQRIAQLEVIAEQSKKDQDVLSGKVDSITETLGEMRQDLSRYRGFWGGALLVVSAIWAFLELFGNWVAARMKGEV